MALTNAYLKKVLQQATDRDPAQPEFLQALTEVLETLEPVVERHPEYEKAALIERMLEPEHAIQFRATWLDDNGAV